MVYCNSCAKILDEDVQFCPICNEEDTFWQGGQGGQALPQDAFYEKPAPVIPHAFRGETFDRLRAINQHIEDNPKWKQEEKRVIYEERPSPLMYAFMLMIAVGLSFVGVIMGIIYINKRNKNYQVLGYITLAISIIFLVIGVLFFIMLIALGMQMV